MTSTNKTVNDEMSLRELQTVIGGAAKTVDMMGDTWVSKGDGHPQQVTHHWGWPLNYLLG